MKKIVFTMLCALIGLTANAQELIKTNRSFKVPYQDWYSGVWGAPADGGKPVVIFNYDKKEGRTDSNSFRAKVKSNSKNGAGNKAVLRRKGIRLKKGKSYTLSFWVKSRFINDEIYASLYSAADTGGKYPWGAIFIKDLSFKSSGEWVKVEHTFEATGTIGKKIDYRKLDLIIGFDKRKGTYWVDDISLTLNK